MMWWIGHLLAAGIGVSLGLIGGGGSVLALPILVYVLNVPTKSAIPMTLVIVGTVSLLGFLPHWRAGHVNFKAAGLFGGATMLGAYGGAKLAAWVPATVQLLLFGFLMLLASVFMIRKSRQHNQDLSALTYYPKPVCRWCWLWLPTEGIGVGLLTGLVGVGGGFAIVPALVLLAKIPIKEAIGTSLLIIALNAVTGFMGYWGQVEIDVALMLSMTVAASLGTIPGAYLARYVSAQHLQKGFGYFLLAMAAFVLFQNRPRPEATYSGYLTLRFLTPESSIPGYFAGDCPNRPSPSTPFSQPWEQRTRPKFSTLPPPLAHSWERGRG